MNKPVLIFVAGPTASGKTDLSVHLARAFDTEIISCDSRQFFSELKIGSAPPDEAHLSAVPHHFIAMKSVVEEYTAGQFEKDAMAILDDLFQKHHAVVMVGGSGLYADAVIKGFNELPNAHAIIREKWLDVLQNDGIQALQSTLQRLDPEYYQQVDQYNPHRLIRALEVIEVTGKPYSEQRSGEMERPFRTIKVALNWPRETLYHRINQRVDLMIDSGLEEEARSLIRYRHLQTLNTVGYKEFFNFFDGNISRDEAVEQIKQNSRRYAKRQLTWLRRMSDMVWFEPGNDQKIIDYLRAEL